MLVVAEAVVPSPLYSTSLPTATHSGLLLRQIKRGIGRILRRLTSSVADFIHRAVQYLAYLTVQYGTLLHTVVENLKQRSSLEARSFKETAAKKVLISSI